jgi:hypothetical protein
MSVEGIGYPPSRERFLDLVYSEDRVVVDEALEQSRQTRDICTINHRIVTPAGEIKWLTQRWQTVADFEWQSDPGVWDLSGQHRAGDA